MFASNILLFFSDLSIKSIYIVILSKYMQILLILVSHFHIHINFPSCFTWWLSLEERTYPIVNIFEVINKKCQSNLVNTFFFLHGEVLAGFKHTFIALNPIQDRLFRGCTRIGGAGPKRPPSVKSVTHILQWWNLTQLHLTQRRSKKYVNHVTHLLTSTDISIFSPEIRK